MRRAKRKTVHKATKRQKARPKPRTRKSSSKNPDKWIGAAEKKMERKGTKGLFTKKAKRAGMGVQQYATYVLSHKGKFSRKTIEEANFAKRMGEL